MFGHDLDRELERMLCIGLVPQEFNFNMFETVEQIVVNQADLYGVPYSLAKERAKSYRAVGAVAKTGDKGKAVVWRYEAPFDDRSSLVHQPKLLILDEPTAVLILNCGAPCGIF